jgi:hypothetical protein
MTKKTWIWIIVSFFAACVIGLVVLAGAGVYYARRHISTSPATAAQALETFDKARAQFKDQQPLIELDSYERPRVTRRTTELPTAKTKPEHLWVLVYNPEEDRVVKISLPFWLLRLDGDLDLRGGNRRIDLDELSLRVDELERIGPMLVLDTRGSSGERVLVWTQ